MQSNNTLPPTYSRNVIHGNNMNKKGCVFAYQRSIRPSKLSFKKAKVTHLLNPVQEQLLRDFGDVVVKAGPPKIVEDVKTYPVNFTIPNCVNNINLVEQAYSRTHARMAVLRRDLLEHFSAKFPVDVDHEIMEI